MEIIPGMSEPGIAPTPAIQPTSRVDKRKMFARSKSVKTCYSMPVPVRIINIVNFPQRLLYQSLLSQVPISSYHLTFKMWYINIIILTPDSGDYKAEGTSISTLKQILEFAKLNRMLKINKN